MQKFDFVILGATGMQGSIVSKELLDKKYNVLLCDKNDYHKDNLHFR